MRLLMRLLFVCAVLSLQCAGAADAPPPPAEDPVAWVPPQARPAFRERLKGEAYQTRLNEAFAHIDLKALDKSAVPGICVSINEVVPDSKASTLGMKPGDFLARLDGAPLLNDDDIVSRRKETPQTLEWVTAAGEAKKSQIPPGRIGVKLVSDWHPDMAYLKCKGRSARFDREMITAATVVQKDPELAETCLFHATKAGFEDPVLDFLGILLAMADCRPDDLDTFAARVMQSEPSWHWPTYIAFHVATKEYRLGFAESLLKKYPWMKGYAPHVDTELAELLARHRALPENIRKRPAPTKYCDDWVFDDLLCRTQNLVDKEAKQESLRRTIDHTQQTLFDGERVDVTLQSNPVNKDPKYTLATFGPGCKNIAMTFHLSVKQNDNVESNYKRFAAIGFLDMDSKDYDEDRNTCLTLNPGALGIGFVPPDQLRVIHSTETLRATLSPPRPYAGFDMGRGNGYAIIVLQGMGEIFCNGRRIFYGPVDGQKLAVYIKTVGMNIHMQDVRIWELVDPADKDAPAIKDVKATFMGGQSRLHRMIGLGQPGQAERLINAGADVSLADERGRTPLQWAAWAGDKKTGELLLKKGAAGELLGDVLLEHYDALAAAAQKNPDALSQRFGNGWTALQVAAGNRQEKMVEFLLKHKANPGVADDDGRTPLHEAVRVMNANLVKQLIDAGANPDNPDKRGWTPRRYAEAVLFTEGVKLMGGSQQGVAPPAPEGGDF